MARSDESDRLARFMQVGVGVGVLCGRTHGVAQGRSTKPNPRIPGLVRTRWAEGAMEHVVGVILPAPALMQWSARAPFPASDHPALTACARRCMLSTCSHLRVEGLISGVEGVVLLFPCEGGAASSKSAHSAHAGATLCATDVARGPTARRCGPTARLLLHCGVAGAESPDVLG